MQLLFEEHDWAALLHTAALLHQHMVRQGEQAQMAVKGIERLTAWRIFCTCSDAVFLIDSKRVGNQRERAAFNWARHLPADILCAAQLAYLADGILGEVSRWLSRSPTNRLTMIEIWHRLRLHFDISGR